MTLESVIERCNPLQFVRLDDEMLAIDGDCGFCYSLNDTAGAIWEHLDEPATIGAICDHLRQDYAVDMATCRADVTATIERLAAMGLVRVTTS